MHLTRAMHLLLFQAKSGNVTHRLVDVVLKLKLCDISSLLDALLELRCDFTKFLTSEATASRPYIVNLEATSAACFVHINAIQRCNHRVESRQVSMRSGGIVS